MRPGLNPWVGKISWRREWPSTPMFLPGEFHGQTSLEGYSEWFNIIDISILVILIQSLRIIMNSFSSFISCIISFYHILLHVYPKVYWHHSFSELCAFMDLHIFPDLLHFSFRWRYLQQVPHMLITFSHSSRLILLTKLQLKLYHNSERLPLKSFSSPAWNPQVVILGIGRFRVHIFTSSYPYLSH